MSIDEMNFDQALEHCRVFVTKSRKALAERRESWAQIEEWYNPPNDPPRPMPPRPLFEETEGILDCMELLLTVAHPPVQGGIVEIGGSSPEHEYRSGPPRQCTICGEPCLGDLVVCYDHAVADKDGQPTNPKPVVE